MIKFKSISLKNFLSYGAVPTVIPLDEPGTTFIIGENLDNTESGVGTNGTGKALTLDSKIKTPTGWTTMDEIDVGDIVSTPDGKQAKVSGVYPQGNLEMFRVTFADGRYVDACGDHLWKVSSHRWRKNYKTNVNKILSTADIKALVEQSDEKNKAWYHIFVPTIEHPTIEDKQVPVHPYVLGCMLGDGCLSTPQLRFSTLDSSIIEQLQTLTEKNNVTFVKDTKTPDWRLNGSYLRDEFRNMGLLGCKSNTKFIPYDYLEELSLNQKLNLIQGLLDTDGTVDRGKCISFSTASPQLAVDVQYLIRSIGGKAKITKRNPSFTYKNETKNGQTSYTVYIQYKHPTNLFTLERKKSKFINDYQYANAGLRIERVEPIGKKPAKCILVDHPDHLFITNDFIVTHNTVIINALAYGIYDKPVSDISKDNLVNNINKKNMEVVVEFEKGEKTYIVKRVRKEKAGATGNYAQLFEDGKDITPDSIGNTNKAIENIMGVPYELFVRIVVFSATSKPFLDLPVRSHYQANQTDIIEELFDLKTLSEKAKLLKKNISDTEQTLENFQQHIKQLEQERDRHLKQTESAKARVENWKKQNQNEINDIERKLKRIQEVDIETQRQAHEKLNNYETQLKQALDEQAKAESTITQLSKDKKKVSNELVHLKDEKCPYCEQAYADAHEKISNKEAKLDDYKAQLNQTLEDTETIINQVTQLSELCDKTRETITIQDIDELLEIKSKSDYYVRRLEELQNAENPFVEPLEELQNIKLEKINYEKLNSLNETLEHQKFLLKLLTKKDSFVRKTLLNKNIPFLNKRLMHYLNELGLPHTVEFTHEMTAKISQFGRPMDFGNLSNGQRSRVNLALSFAFRDVLQNMHEYINVCMLDEVLDIGLDSVGVQAAARMLKRKARDENLSLLIISHRDEIDGAFDKTLTVQMSKGFSFLKQETN